jgi:hypothetical protein
MNILGLILKSWLFALLICGACVSEAPKKLYKLSICAIFKNEAPYLKEWIEYHKLVGVDHFYLYNNESDDNYMEVLADYIKAGEVTLFDWPTRQMDQWGHRHWAWVYTTQVPAYENAFQIAKGTSKWVAAIDIDEFIVPVKVDRITQVLDKIEKNFPAIEIYWRVYGTSGLDEIPPNRLLIESLNKRSFSYASINQTYKTILKPEEFNGYTWPPHQCKYRNKLRAFPPTTKDLIINHYSNRTKNYFISQKIKSKERMDNVQFSAQEIAQMAEIGNDEEDKERLIHRFVPALRQKMNAAKPDASDLTDRSE